MNLAARRASTILIIVVSAGVMIVATFGEYALGVLGPTLNRDLGVSTSMIGILTAIMFGASGIVSAFIGPMVDRIAPATMSLALILLSAIVFVSFAFAESEAGLIVACVLIGAVMAICGPLSNRLVSAYLPPSAHATAISWKSLGPQLGALMAGLAFGGMAELFNWRHIIIVISVLMVVFGLYCFYSLRHRLFFHPMSMEGLPANSGDRTDDGVIDEDERTQPIAWWLIAWSFFFGGAVSSVGAYIPAYATNELHMSLALAGAAGAVIAAVSVVARFVWVYFLRFLDFVTVLVLAGVSAALATVVLAMAPSLGAPAFWLAIVLVGATALGASPVVQIVLVGATNRKEIGFVSAMNGVGLYAGFTFQPLVIAFLMERFGFAMSWYFMAGSALIAALVIVAYAMVHGRPRGPHLARKPRELTDTTRR